MTYSMKTFLAVIFLALFISLKAIANPLANSSFPSVDGVVHSVVEDSAGGWFIGGEFSAVAGVSTKNIARINSNYTLDDTWNPSINGSIQFMILSKDVLYVAGKFSEVDYLAKSDSEEITTITRNNLAAFNRINGQPMAWNPDANGSVRQIILDESCKMALVKGEFSQVGGTPFINEARVSTIQPSAVWVIDETINQQDVANSDPDAPTVWVNPAGGMFTKSQVATFSCSAGAGKAENEGCTVYCDARSFPGPPTTEELNEFTGPVANSEFACDVRKRLGGITNQVVYIKFLAVNENGKSSEMQTKVFLFDPKGPLTTACPSTTVFDSKTKKVTLHCSDIGKGCGKTYYSTDGTYPTVDNSLIYEGPFELDGNNTNYIVRFFSEDEAGNQEAVKQESYIGIYGGFGALHPLFFLLPLLILVYRRIT